MTRSTGTFKPNHHTSSCLCSADLPLWEFPVPSLGLVKSLATARFIQTEQKWMRKQKCSLMFDLYSLILLALLFDIFRFRGSVKKQHSTQLPVFLFTCQSRRFHHKQFCHFHSLPFVIFNYLMKYKDFSITSNDYSSRCPIIYTGTIPYAILFIDTSNNA